MCVCVYSFKSGVRVNKCPAAAVTSWKHRGALTLRAALQNLFYIQQIQDMTRRGPCFLFFGAKFGLL